MSIYFGNQQISASTLNTAAPITIDQIGLHTFDTGGDVIFNGTRIFPYGFARVSTLTSFTAPNLLRITQAVNDATNGTGTAAFEACTNLVSINMPELVNLGTGGYQFNGCSKLANVNLPKAAGSPGNYVFSGCTSLEHIFLPKFALTGTYSFNGCTKLLTAVFPYTGVSAAAMGGNSFKGCSKLTSVDIGHVTQVKANDFLNCTVMNILVLRHTSMASLANVNAFSGTPFASGKAGGTLYVPEALIDTYSAGTNWVTILGYGSGAQNSIKSIESTHTDPTAPIDLTLYYVDGTPIT